MKRLFSTWLLVSVAASVWTVACGLPPPLEEEGGPVTLDESELQVDIFPPETSFQTTLMVDLVASEPGAEIYYTTDGTDPTPLDARRYEQPIELTSNTLVSALAVGTGGSWSDVASAFYRHEPLPDPVALAPRAVQADRGEVVFVARPGIDEMFQSVRIRSVGRQPVILVDATISEGALADPELEGPAFSLMDSVAGRVVEPGTWVDVEVRYQATPVTRSGTLRIRSDASGPDADLRITLWGRLFR